MFSGEKSGTPSLESDSFAEEREARKAARIEAKIAQLRDRFRAAEDWSHDRANALVAALMAYADTRRTRALLTSPAHSAERVQNADLLSRYIHAIQATGLSIEEIEREFASFSEEELRLIGRGLAY